MADVLLLHHAQGQTPGLRAFADALRAAGHAVHAPDLYGGESFATLDEGMAKARSIGFGTLQEQGVAAAEDLPRDLVYAGFSLGVMAAQRLAQTRPGRPGCRPARRGHPARRVRCRLARRRARADPRR